MVVIAGFGNPLLDLTVTISDDRLLDKYSIRADDIKEISALQMQALIQEIEKLQPVLTPGGSVQNTLRIIQWLLAVPNSTVMYGAIGQDEQGESLKKLVELDGVQTRYFLQPGKHTGTGVALVNGEIRTLMAHIGAAQYINIRDFQSEEFLRGTDLVYMEAFFLTLRMPVAKYVYKICQHNKIPFAFNLNAIYMASNFTTDVLHFANECDVLIGNYEEYKALIQALKLDIDVKSFCTKLTQTYSNSNSMKYGKICAITNGTQQVLCVHSLGVIETEDVVKLSPAELVDTTGAGDAFAAGFLYGLLQNRMPKECLKWGCAVAKEIIQQVGCSIPHSKTKCFEKMFTINELETQSQT